MDTPGTPGARQWPPSTVNRARTQKKLEKFRPTHMHAGDTTAKVRTPNLSSAAARCLLSFARAGPAAGADRLHLCVWLFRCNLASAFVSSLNFTVLLFFRELFPVSHPRSLFDGSVEQGQGTMQGDPSRDDELEGSFNDEMRLFYHGPQATR